MDRPTLRVARRLALTSLCLVALAGMLPDPVLGAGRRSSSIIEGKEVRRSSANLTATYDVKGDVSWADARLGVRAAITVTNTSGFAIDRLELNTIAGPLSGMTLIRAQVDGQPVAAKVDGQTILVPFGGTLPKGATVEVVIRYSAKLRAKTNGLSWAFAKAEGMITAYRWIPWVSRKRQFRNVAVGDPYFTPISPRVRVKLTTDRPLVLVTSGRRVASNGLSRTYVAENVRDFNFTAAPDFVKTAGRSADGETSIAVYTRTATRAQRAQMLKRARVAFDAFEKRIGRYPYPRYVISEAPGGTGLESPGLTWIGRRAIGTATGSYLLVHETGHQWFYAVVGNDQPRQPFADEGVTEYLTRWHLGTFRASDCAKGRLDGSIYAYSSGECFYETVYVQGASFLNAIRQDIGTGRFWAALRGYWKANRFGFGSSYELLQALKKAAKAAGVNLLPRYRDRFPSLY